MWLLHSASCPPLHSLIIRVLDGTDKLKMIFILDPTAIPEVDHLVVQYGMPVLCSIFYMARTYAYGLHRKKLIITGRWPYATDKSNQINSHSVAGEDDRTRTVEYEPARARARTQERGVVANMTREQDPHAINQTVDICPDVPLPQDPAIFITVGPEQGGLPGCAGHVAALDHLAGVVVGSCVERSMLGCSGSSPASPTRNTFLAPEIDTHSEGTPWSPSDTALSVHQQDCYSFQQILAHSRLDF